MVSVFTVFWSYQPKGVSLRLCHEPEANAFRLISHLQSSVFIWFLSGTLSLASGFRMILSNKPCANALRLMSLYAVQLISCDYFVNVQDRASDLEVRLLFFAVIFERLVI